MTRRSTLAAVSLPAVMVFTLGAFVVAAVPGAEKREFVAVEAEPPATVLPVVTAISESAQVASPGDRGQARHCRDAPGAYVVVGELVPPQLPVPTTVVPTEPCDYAAFLAVVHAPPGGWDAARMVRYMLRETGGTCDPTLRSSTSDTGLWQINDVNLPYLRRVLGEWVDRWTLMDPVQNVRAAAALCEFWRAEGSGCYQPWS